MGIVYHENIRKKLLSGVNALADAVAPTLGPLGRNTAMYQKANIRGAEYADRARPDAHVLVTNDGATIASGIVLPDPVEDMGAQLLKEAAAKTNAAAGDGTTTAIVLTRAVLREAFRNIAAGADPMALRRGIRAAGDLAARELEAVARPADTEEMLSRAGAVSCGEEELGKLIGRALHNVGPEGVVTVDESQTLETTLDLQEGIVFDRGFLSPLMTTDERQTVAELHDPYILICDTKFTDSNDLLPALILAAEDERSCLIISEGVEGDAMGLILKNKLEGDMDVVCVTAPLYGEGRRWRMEDMAVQTGGVFITKERSLNIRDVTREMLGTAKTVKVTRERTVIAGPGGDPTAVERKIKEIRHAIEHSDYEFNTERYRERLAKFVSGVARLYVGGRTEAELWERKLRAEDAVNAARAAGEEGVVPGGGIALLNLSQTLSRFAETLKGDERTGAMLVAAAVRAPARQILDNAGLDGASLTEKLLSMEPGTGYDVLSGDYTDMLEAGVMDPVKVTRLTLENALSVSMTILTTEAGVVLPERGEERSSA